MGRPLRRSGSIGKMHTVGIIPARYASTRFPGKPLAMIAGIPMIQHVYQRTRTAKHLDDVFVATDDDRIAKACQAFGAPVLMTRSDHPTGTDRLAEASRQLDAEVVVNVQGDEPLIEGFVIDAAVAALLETPDTPMSTVVHALDGPGIASPGPPNSVWRSRSQALNRFESVACRRPRLLFHQSLDGTAVHAR